MQSIGQNIYLKSVMSGMMLVLPATIMSSLATLLKVFPFAPYQAFLVKHDLVRFFDIPINFTNNFLAVIVAFSVAYTLAKNLNADSFMSGLLSMISFFILTPYQLGDVGPLGQSFAIPSHWLGAMGLFTGILVAITATRIFVAITRKGLIIKMPDTVPEFISKSFSSLVPGIVILTFFTVVSAAITINGLGSIHEIIYKLIQAPLTSLGSGIGSLIFVAILAQLLWFFGLHGHAITLGIVAPIWFAMDAQQLAAYAAGITPPNITGFAFFMTYGVAGDLLPLAFMLAFLAKSNRYQTLGKIALPPAVFTIGEPMAYGVPLVMNFALAIPYIFINGLMLGLAYYLTVIGILPRVAGVSTPAGIPVIVSGFMQGSWKIAAFQFVGLFIRFAGWYFFFKIADAIACKEENAERVNNS
ncbi:PTS sugar transporter subunit IIC [Pectobacterium polaris]|uniref:Permease IIC component n=1 Tax=Pectobacterium polaris TaxID=2042057 RepID=A0AAW4NV24_9GAMM|nr:PTS transporter subunit EIIC [Pectobacterium polaris]MBW5890947.1 PTS sugar transporter subunit IIC [Pectobacterium polaris]MCA6951381.1 PTS transporter subunit EIIC [Pectobacterium polaris]UAY94308.1 PTS transporter subunit EIIC [Pectobacterium polaris]